MLGEGALDVQFPVLCYVLNSGKQNGEQGEMGATRVTEAVTVGALDLSLMGLVRLTVKLKLGERNTGLHLSEGCSQDLNQGRGWCWGPTPHPWPQKNWVATVSNSLPGSET